jgi:sulfur dioxygenase
MEEPDMVSRQVFDAAFSTYTYLTADLTTQTALLVAPVSEQVERDRQLLQELGLIWRYCLETHIHTNHITGTAQLQMATGD